MTFVDRRKKTMCKYSICIKIAFDTPLQIHTQKKNMPTHMHVHEEQTTCWIHSLIFIWISRPHHFTIKNISDILFLPFIFKVHEICFENRLIYEFVFIFFCHILKCVQNEEVPCLQTTINNNITKIHFCLRLCICVSVWEAVE